MQTRRAVGPNLAALDLTPEPSDRLVYQSRFVPFIIKDENGRPIVSVIQQALQNIASTTSGDSSGGMGSINRPGNDIELGQSASDFGIVLLERTRLRPSGFALGEHLLSLSLAPSEEVTIEQKTFSERAVTFEELSESDQEISTESGSTYTTELSEALSQVMSDAKNRGFSAGGSFGFNYFVNLTVSASYTDSVNTALSTTEAETVRNVMTKTEKLTARRRAQHKVTMKIAETTRFETGNKRVIRNPNQYTPVDLVYFKLLQKLEVAHERYGVRLCWAPFIPDPGIVLDQAEASARATLERQSPLNLPVLRPQPQAPGAPPPETVSSTTVELTSWMSPWGDMKADYWFELIPSAPNFQWDGNSSSIESSFTVSTTGFGRRGPPNVKLVRAEPFDAGSGKGGCRVLVHAGADWGGAGAHLYLEFKVTFVPNVAGSNAAHQADLAQWHAEKAAHEAEVGKRTAERKATIDAAVAAWRVGYMRSFDPVATAYQLLIAKMFPTASMRDEGFEVEMWSKIFDFESTAFQYYPSWWSDRGRRSLDKPADAFENASWMRVFLPIRPGFETQALNLIIERRVFTQTFDPARATAIKKVLDELSTARSTYFGGADEVLIRPVTGECPVANRPYVCLAHWEELLPTDGTHLEVVQAKTTAIDDATEQSISDAHLLMTARTGSQSSEGNLTTALTQKMAASASDPDVDVHIGIGTRREE